MEITIRDNEGVDEVKSAIKVLVKKYFETDDIEELINELEEMI